MLGYYNEKGISRTTNSPYQSVRIISSITKISLNLYAFVVRLKENFINSSNFQEDKRGFCQCRKGYKLVVKQKTYSPVRNLRLRFATYHLYDVYTNHLTSLSVIYKVRMVKPALLISQDIERIKTNMKKCL